MKGGDKMKSNILAIGGVALVVAILASLVTLSMTGNLVKVPTSTATTQTDIYTKVEVDTLMRNVNSGVLSMFRNRCIITNPNLYYINATYTASDVCTKYNLGYNKTTACVLADQFNGGKTQVLTCDLSLNTATSGLVHVMCCTP